MAVDEAHARLTKKVPGTVLAALPGDDGGSGTSGPRGTARGGTRLRDLVRALRPKQWAKNVLVFAAPAGGAVLFNPLQDVRALLAFLAFCAAASSMYLMNDLADRVADSTHPRRRNRPIAAGLVSPGVARLTAISLLLGSVAMGAALSWQLALVLVSYLVTVSAYSLGVKRVAVVELVVVASGFVLRVLAGAVAVNVPVSQWLLLLVSFASLFMVAGKRFADLQALGERAAAARSSLASYTLPYLRFVWMFAAAIAVVFYSLWSISTAAHHGALAELSVIPFTVAILRYGLLLETGHGGDPEEVALQDRPLQVLALAWLAVYLVGVYVG